MLSQEERKKLMTENPPEIHEVFHGNAYFNWSWAGCGFGQLSFSYDREKEQWTCMNECMSRESVRKILHSLADHIADTAILEDC